MCKEYKIKQAGSVFKKKKKMATKNVSFCVKKGENWNCSPRSVLDPQSYPENEFPADSQLSEQGHKGQICLLRG